MKRSSSGRTFGAQLLADPSAPRRWLRRFSLTGDGTLISCTLPDGLTTLSVRGRTPRRTAPSPRPDRRAPRSSTIRTAVLRLGDVHVHADVALDKKYLIAPAPSAGWPQ